MINGTKLIYNGKVNIKVGRKTYSNFNAGTISLFELFARTLVKGSIDPQSVPTSIDIVKTVPGSTTSILNARVNIYKQYREENGIPCCVITSAITDSNIAQSVDNDSGSFKLKLISGDLKDLAEIEIDSTILSQIEAGRQAIIEWSLYITNGGDN